MKGLHMDMLLVRNIICKLQEVNHLTINIKKKTAHNIFFGEDIATGITKYITEVESGAKCGCVCASCKKPLEARKGTQRRHHFAHDTNYDCVYSNEVAIYKRVAEVLDRDRTLCVPEVMLKFANWKEPSLLKARHPLKLDDVHYQCEPLQYPPEFLVTSAGSRLRILIEFDDKYYSRMDLTDLIAEGKREGYSILLLNMPQLTEGNEEFYTRENLSRCFSTHGVPGRWIRSALEEKWRERYLALVTEPRRIQDLVECPLHKVTAGSGGQFYVDRRVCSQCEYYLEEEKCIGASGIREISDFGLPREELQERVRELQRKNEEEAAEHEKRWAESICCKKEKYLQQQMRQSRFQMQTEKTQFLFPNYRPVVGPSEYELEEERKRISALFDPSSPDRTFDKYGCRWIMCEHCGELRLDTEMVEYGGPKGPNLGTCRYCSRGLN